MCLQLFIKQVIAKQYNLLQQVDNESLVGLDREEFRVGQSPLRLDIPTPQCLLFLARFLLGQAIEELALVFLSGQVVLDQIDLRVD